MTVGMPIPNDIVEAEGLTVDEFLYLVLNCRTRNLQEIKDSLIKKNIGFLDKKGTFFAEQKDEKFAVGLISKMLKYYEIMRTEAGLDVDLIPLAEKLQELYPKGTRPGCSTKWRGSKLIIAQKLTQLKNKLGLEFTDEEAIDATRRYVESFHEDYTYMECLQYFILRLQPEFKSNFAAYLEDTDSGNDSSPIGDYMTKMR